MPCPRRATCHIPSFFRAAPACESPSAPRARARPQLVRPHKKVALAAKVWVGEKGQPFTREPTESELRKAQLREQPPIMMPRIKRNM